MKLISTHNVKLTGGFMKEKQDLVRKSTLNAVWNRFVETGRVGAYECNPKAKFPAHVFWDSDVIKWAEGAAYYLGIEYDKELDDKINMLASFMEKNAFEDGYYNCFYAVHPELTRFTNRSHHELYCAGHLFEASVAYFEATGNDRLIKISERYADCIYKIFVAEKSASFTTPGHEEIELGLLRLYSATKKGKYLELAKFFIDMRGKGIKENLDPYSQSHMPVRKMREAVGHAVRACYLYSAMADLAAETGDNEIAAACDALFKNITREKMYITGGIGSTKIGEAFTEGYDLPNQLAYTETCAAISLLFFAIRMQRLNNNTEFADVAELALYNGILSGLSLDGKAFFYTNPLEINLRDRKRVTPNLCAEIFPITERKRVFNCSCCPPNISRFFPSVGGYAYGKEGGTVYVNLYMDSIVDFEGAKVRVTTDYPKDGVIKVECNGVSEIKLRLPFWAKDFTVDTQFTLDNRYITIKNPCSFTLTLDMAVRFVKASPKVKACLGKVAVMRGPVVYCAEGVDNDFNIFDFHAGKGKNATICEDFGGLPTLSIEGYICTEEKKLYYFDGDDGECKTEKTQIKLIPYNAFANRGETDMALWLNG